MSFFLFLHAFCVAGRAFSGVDSQEGPASFREAPQEVLSQQHSGEDVITNAIATSGHESLLNEHEARKTLDNPNLQHDSLDALTFPYHTDKNPAWFIPIHLEESNEDTKNRRRLDLLKLAVQRTLYRCAGFTSEGYTGDKNDVMVTNFWEEQRAAKAPDPLRTIAERQPFQIGQPKMRIEHFVDEHFRGLFGGGSDEERAARRVEFLLDSADKVASFLNDLFNTIFVDGSALSPIMQDSICAPSTQLHESDSYGRPSRRKSAFSLLLDESGLDADTKMKMSYFQKNVFYQFWRNWDHIYDVDDTKNRSKKFLFGESARVMGEWLRQNDERILNENETAGSARKNTSENLGLPSWSKLETFLTNMLMSISRENKAENLNDFLNDRFLQESDSSDVKDRQGELLIVKKTVRIMRLSSGDIWNARGMNQPTFFPHSLALMTARYTDELESFLSQNAVALEVYDAEYRVIDYTSTWSRTQTTLLHKCGSHDSSSRIIVHKPIEIDNTLPIREQIVKEVPSLVLPVSSSSTSQECLDPRSLSTLLDVIALRICYCGFYATQKTQRPQGDEISGRCGSDAHPAFVCGRSRGRFSTKKVRMGCTAVSPPPLMNDFLAQRISALMPAHLDFGASGISFQDFVRNNRGVVAQSLILDYQDTAYSPAEDNKFSGDFLVDEDAYYAGERATDHHLDESKRLLEQASLSGTSWSAVDSFKVHRHDRVLPRLTCMYQGC